MTNPNQTSEANSTSSNAGKSFAVGALTSTVSSGVISSVYLTGLSEIFAASAEGVLALAAVCVGVATAVGLVASSAAEGMLGLKKEDSHNKKALGAGALTGLLTAAALTLSLTGDADQQSTESAQSPQAPVAFEILPYMLASNMKLASLCPTSLAEQVEPVLLPHMKPALQNSNPCPTYKPQTFDSK